LDRLCYRVSFCKGTWIVDTSAPWPDALSFEFSTREEAVQIASIAAQLAWEQGAQPTCVCVRESNRGQTLLACRFG
jgi:hypothetical protein